MKHLRLFVGVCALMITTAINAAVNDKFTVGIFSFQILTENENNKTGTVNVTLADKSSVTDVTIPENVSYNNWVYTVSRAYQMNNCPELTNVTFANTITSLGNGVFSNNPKLKTVSLSQNLEIIPQNAFLNCTALESITIPSSVISIEGYAFKGCSALATVNFSEGLQTIGLEAFYNSGITQLILPQSVTDIKRRVFSNCENLVYVHYGANLKNIGEATVTDNSSYLIEKNSTVYEGQIQGCSKLESITVDENNPYFCTHNGNVYTKDKKTLVHVVKLSDRTGDVVIDDGVEHFYNGIFTHHEGITSVTLPNSVKSLSRQLFSSCYNLKTINLQDTQIETIGWECFTNSYRIEQIYLPSTLKIIDARGFSGMDSIRVIKIPNSCTYIGGRGLRDNVLWQHVTMPSWIKSIGSYLLSMYSTSDVKITEFTLPASFEDYDFASKENFQKGEFRPIISLNNNLTSYYVMGSHIPNFIFYDLGNPNATAQNANKTVYVKKSVYDELYPDGHGSLDISVRTSSSKVTTNNYSIQNISYRIPLSMTNAAGNPIEYKTLCRDFDVDLTHTNDNLPEGVEPLRAYVVEDVDGDLRMVFLDEIKYIPSRLKANATDENGNLYQGVDEYVGVVLRGTPGYTYYYEMGEHDYTQGASGQWLMDEAMAYSNASFEQNLMAGDANDEFYVHKTIEDDNNNEIVNYGLNNNRFKIYYKDGWLNYNKSYLKLPKNVSEAIEGTADSEGNVNLTFMFNNSDGSTDKISSVEFMRNAESDIFYNPYGQRVSKDTKGIVINNGKKFVNK